MKKWIVAGLLAFGLVSGAVAAQGAFPLDRAPDLSNDVEALQRGGKLFVNYCLSCHAASFERYKRFKELGLTERQIRENFLFTDGRVGDLMQVAISPADAKVFWGKAAPDLTMITRSRAGSGGTDYIFTLLRSYYRDDMIAHGWNNLAFPNIAMPNPLWYLQGERRPIIETVANADGSSTQVLRGWEQVTPGTMSPEEFDRSVAELVAFLDWLAEPHQDQRQQLGIFVLLFLAGFTVLAWKLNKEYWKDIK